MVLCSAVGAGVAAYLFWWIHGHQHFATISGGHIVYITGYRPSDAVGAHICGNRPSALTVVAAQCDCPRRNRSRWVDCCLCLLLGILRFGVVFLRGGSECCNSVPFRMVAVESSANSGRLSSPDCSCSFSGHRRTRRHVRSWRNRTPHPPGTLECRQAQVSLLIGRLRARTPCASLTRTPSTAAGAQLVKRSAPSRAIRTSATRLFDRSFPPAAEGTARADCSRR